MQSSSKYMEIKTHLLQFVAKIILHLNNNLQNLKEKLGIILTF